MKQFFHQMLDGHDFVDSLDIASDENQPLVNISFDRIDKGG
jgi:hypothetical protein